MYLQIPLKYPRNTVAELYIHTTHCQITVEASIRKKIRTIRITIYNAWQ
jgi:hypothetical protein